MAKPKKKWPRVRLSIRYKILFVVGILLVTAVGFYTLLASSIFKQEKTALLYDMNHSIAINAAAQIQASLGQIANQLQLYALAKKSSSRLRLPESFLEGTSIKQVALFEKRLGRFTPVGISPLNRAPKQWAHLLLQAEQHGYAFWRSESTNPIDFYFATHLKTSLKNKSTKTVVLATLNPAPFFRSLQTSTLFQSYLIQKDGHSLVHCDREKRLFVSALKQHPVLDTIKTQPPSQSGVTSYTFGEQDWYGAYAPVGIAGLYVISQAEQSEVGTALDLLVKRSLLFGLIAITATFLVSILFSKSLTKNLHRLTLMAQKIGKGDLRSKIRIRSRDEVENLAASFNAMIDELRLSKEAIEKHNRELEEKVAERTQELKQKNIKIEEIQNKLLQSTQLAAAGEMAGRTAHEVLNPLTAIIGRLEKVSPDPEQPAPGLQQIDEILEAWGKDYQKGGLDELVNNLKTPSTVNPSMNLFDEDLNNLKAINKYLSEQQQQAAQDLQFIQQQAHRIQRIVDGMREMVRASSVKSDVNCHESIEQASLTLSDLFESHEIELQKVLQAKQSEAHLNGDELIQIITNLLRNSFQAIYQKQENGKNFSALIKIVTSNLDGQLVIDIIDNGIGIRPSEQDSVFKQGYTTKAPSEGTGLGLAICRRYARAMGGEVSLLYSEPHQRGTCFRITIPDVREPSVPVAI